MVITAYRPIPGSGPYTVYQQHVDYYSSINNTKCPITNYDNDLIKIIEAWTDSGDQVILMIDANVALQKNNKGSFRRRMEEIGMNELILSQHPHLKPPATRSPGTNTIDSIFGTGSLIVKKAGYGPHLGFTDHRLAWVDIDWDSALGIFQKNTAPYRQTPPM